MNVALALEEFGARVVAGRIESFVGDADALGAEGAADAAGASGPMVTPLLATGLLSVSGPDARDFLHGQLANDVRGLAVGGQCLSLLLNHKGHALADVNVLRLADGLLLAVEDGALGLVESSLRSHIVFDDVTMRRVDGVMLTVQGALAAEALAAAGLPVPGSEGAWAGQGHAGEMVAEGGVRVYSFARRRSRLGGVDVLFEVAAPGEVGGSGPAAGPTVVLAGAPTGAPTGALPGALTGALTGALLRLRAAGARLTGEMGLDAARVEALVSAAAYEGGDGVLPQEADMVPRLSYSKGCYLGQEIMARIEARGNLKRALARLEFDADEGLPQRAEVAGSAVTLDGRTVGRLGTFVSRPGGGAQALAVLRRDLPDGAALEALGARARVVAWGPL